MYQTFPKGQLGSNGDLIKGPRGEQPGELGHHLSEVLGKESQRHGAEPQYDDLYPQKPITRWTQIAEEPCADTVR